MKGGEVQKEAGFYQVTRGDVQISEGFYQTERGVYKTSN